MRRSRNGSIPAAILVLAAILVAIPPARGSDPPQSPGSPIGFTPTSGKKQREAEAHALTVPTPENARRWLRILTAEPHVAGTPGRLQDRRLRPRQAPRMGLEGRSRGAGGPAQLSGSVPSLSTPATDLTRLSTSTKHRRHRQGLRQHQGLRRLQRLRRLGRRVRTGRLRELRPARRLRGAREDGDRRQGQDRPGPLRRAVPRLEGPERPEARGHGDPDLLRSGRRWIMPRAMSIPTADSGRVRPSSAGASSSCRWGRAIPPRRSVPRSRVRSGSP